MQLRVRQGKGAKERVLPLSPRLLQELEQYWLAQRAKRPGHDSPWLFLGTKPDEPINKATGQNTRTTPTASRSATAGSWP
jgi:site-specific recombinase XerD